MKEYILSFFTYMIIAFIILFITKLIINKGKLINKKRELTIITFFSYIIGVLSQALKLGDKETSFINLVPFKIIIRDIKSLINGDYLIFLINIVGNILLFIPIGILVPMLWKIKDRYVILIGFLISLSIEITQLYLGRVTDIDDLILNTSGVIIGLLVYKCVNKKEN